MQSIEKMAPQNFTCGVALSVGSSISKTRPAGIKGVGDQVAGKDSTMMFFPVTVAL